MLAFRMVSKRHLKETNHVGSAGKRPHPFPPSFFLGGEIAVAFVVPGTIYFTFESRQDVKQNQKM